jgi:hypothetical protein
VHITIRETFSLLLSRDGELKAFDAKGDMDLRINNGLYSKVKVHLSDLDHKYLSPGYNLQLQQHPNVVKFSAASPETVIQLKDPNKSFPVGQGLGVLRWRLSTKSDSAIPLIGQCKSDQLSILYCLTDKARDSELLDRGELERYFHR